MSLSRVLRVHAAAAAFLCAASQAAVNIIPQPLTQTPGSGTLTFGASEVVSIYRDTQSDSTLPWVEKLFRNVKIPTSRAASTTGAKVVITMQADATLGSEGYKLNVTGTQVLITAPTLTGQFYAVQTLRQMFPFQAEDSLSGFTGAVTIDQVSITDKPRLEYRGLMIDPVRRWIPMAFLYQIADRMALFKLNRLHLLLSNDQGYRLESKVFPRLHEVGSPTEVGGCKPTSTAANCQIALRGNRWYYTHDEMRAFVKYAALRKIQIVPEIDMPGHVGAMVFCYPEIGTYEQQPGNPGIRTDEKVEISSLYTSQGNAQELQRRRTALAFIGQLWREMLTVFPWHQYQMGGDEWKYGITSPAIYRQFVQEVQDTLTKLGKQTIAWDDVKTQGGLRSGNWSQDWHIDNNNGDVLSSCNRMYLDHRNTVGDGTNAMNWCVAEVTLQTVYGTIIPGNIKGVEGIMFSERMAVYPDYWDRQIWPRQAAVAEIGWAPTNNNPGSFLARLGTFGARLSSMGVKFYRTPGVTWSSATTNARMTSLYNGFVPDPSSTGIRMAPGKKGPGRKADSYNVLGRAVRFSPSGHPEGLRFFLKP